MKGARIIIVTGLPATGKSTLAREVSARLRVPLLAKDAIKEPLLDCFGATDAAQSRRLSDASFAVLFALTRDVVASGADAVLEGNFRPGEHEASFRSSSVRIAQILCVLDEPQRLARLAARARDLTRHAGHRDADLAAQPLPTHGNGFLDLPGARFRCGADASNSGLLAQLERWWGADSRTV
jgi:predicted kinase